MSDMHRCFGWWAGGSERSSPLPRVAVDEDHQAVGVASIFEALRDVEPELDPVRVGSLIRDRVDAVSSRAAQ